MEQLSRGDVKGAIEKLDAQGRVHEIVDHGERLKEIGRLARIELNDLWQRSVHLELWVKVKENWADSEMALRQFGYDTL